MVGHDKTEKGNNQTFVIHQWQKFRQPGNIQYLVTQYSKSSKDGNPNVIFQQQIHLPIHVESSKPATCDQDYQKKYCVRMVTLLSFSNRKIH